MEVQFSPNPIDEPSLLYKLQRKLKVFNANSLPNRGYNLITTASKYGLVFVASTEGILQVYYLRDLIDKECEPAHLSIQLQEKPTHISTSCDQELLAVTDGRTISIYKIIEFQNPNVSPFVCISCEVLSTFVSSVQWNPCIPDIIAIAYFDGTLMVSSITNNLTKKIQSKARCICWSPKGKQLVVGNSDGTLCQYKPDLSPMKNVPPPNLFNGAPVEAIAIHWVSTFQFAVVYRNASDESRPSVTIVNTPKGGQSSCFNYEDICYSMGSSRPWYYYLQGLPQWNIILASSSNSMEIATLATTDGANWIQWCQMDEARPELPLTDKKQENYPVGVCIDTCAIHQLPWGENDILPYMPMLFVLSHSGYLTMFNVINLNKNAPQVCLPPQQLLLPAAAMISIPCEPQPTEVAPIPAPEKPAAPIPQISQQPLPNFSQFNVNLPSSTPKPTLQVSSFSQVPAAPKATIQVEVKPQAPVQPQAHLPTHQINVPKPVFTSTEPVQISAPTTVTTPQDINTAKLIEDQKQAKLKANEELKSMLVKEVNEFQMELYNFVKKSDETHQEVFRTLNSIKINPNLQSMDPERLKKDCSVEDLRSAIIQLKLELVRACAVVAEARTHADSNEIEEWTQPDPLTSKYLASIKKLTYYVQTQLDQAFKSIDYQWNEMSRQLQQNDKSGPRMIRPILDDVYQPLVKQQQILSRQEAVLKALRKTFNECDIVTKSTSMLRNTPFRKDPLSKLTKNILNMSIEPQSKNTSSCLTPRKLDALRDMLANHKTARIKPVNIEQREHFTAMRLSHEKTLKQKVAQDPVKVEAERPIQEAATIVPIKSEVKQDVQKIKLEVTSEDVKTSVPAVTTVKPIPGLSSVTRKLFTDDTKDVVLVQTPVAPKPCSKFGTNAPSGTVTSVVDTRNILRDLLQNKLNSAEYKNDVYSLTEQPICSPTTPAVSTTKSPFSVQTFLPPNGNVFQQGFNQPKFSFDQNVAKQNNLPNNNRQSAETGEAELLPKDKKNTNQSTEQTTSISKLANTINISVKLDEKTDKVASSVFGTKSITVSNVQNVPDVLKPVTPSTSLFGNNKSKENVVFQVTEKTANLLPKENQASEKENLEKPKQIDHKVLTPVDKQDTITANQQATVKPSLSLNVTATTTESLLDSKTVTKPSSPIASSLFAAANAANGATPTQNLFASMAAPTGSIFTSTSPSNSSIFGSSTKPVSLFGVTSTTTAATVVTTIGAITATTVQSSQSKSLFDSTPSIQLSQKSVFGVAAITTPPTTLSSVFTSTTQATSIFTGSPSSQTSIFDSSPTKSKSIVSVTSTASVTTLPTTTLPTQTSIFTTPVTSSPQPSLFAVPAIQSSIFGTTATTQSNIFGTTTATSTAPSSVFDSPSTTTSSVFVSPNVTTQSSIFASPTTTIQQSVFGTTTPPSQSSIFGSATATVQPSVFGTSPATTQSSIFGTTATQSSIFGVMTSTTPPSVFGTPTATTQPSVFGTPTSTIQSSVFGTPTSTTQSSVFGTPTSTTQSSIFGTPTAATQSSIFSTPTKTQASVFGSPSATQSSIFGTSTATTQASVFGTSPVSPQSSIFGVATTTGQNASPFGGAEANLFASASISPTNAPSQTSAGSIFGKSNSASGGAAFSGNLFGGKSTAFGQWNTAGSGAASVFSGGSNFGQQKQDNNFWGGASNTTSTFGSGFGQSTQASSVFGGSFSSNASPGQAFSNPTAQGSVFSKPEGQPAPNASVFGTPNQQTASAFGGSPVFSSKPVFGQTASFSGSPSGFGSFSGLNKSPSSGFGAAASFGGGAAFGGTSPTKGFGSSPSAPGFGATQSNATFENLANQNTLTFGNLAQQSGQPQQSNPAFNASPSFTGWRS